MGASASAVTIIAVVAIAAALSVARAVFAPLACALLVIALIWPVQAYLQTRIPRHLALLFCVLVSAVVFAGFASLAAWAFGRVGQSAVSEAARLQVLYSQAAAWLEGHGVAIGGVWSEYFNAGWMLRALQNVTSRVNTTLSFWLVVFVYVILGLLEVDDFREKARRLSNQRLGRLLIAGCAETAAKLRRFMVVRTLMSVMTGILVWLFAHLVGLELAREWGIIAFALNYIPFIGPFLATTFPTLFAMIHFETWTGVIFLFVGLNVVQFIVGSYIEPRVSGTQLSISPLVILLSVFLWSYMWGIFGAFIGVPISIAILTFCALDPASRWIAELLGSAETPPSADSTAR